MNLNQNYFRDSKKHYNNQLLSMLPIDTLTPLENQPRHHMDQKSLDELAQSIRTYGILQPLIVTKENDGRMTIVAGERRWRAAKLAGLELIPCITRNFEEYSRLELALIENIQRESLSPWEEIQCMHRLLDEYDYTHEQLATRIGKSRSAVTNALRLLSLPHQVLENLHTGTISAVHARTLCGLNDEKLQLKMLSIIIKKKLSVRQTEELIKKLKTEKPHKILGDSISADLRYICDQFKGHLGTKVKISGDTNTGKIEISYYSSEDLERISDVILGADIFAQI